MSAPTAEGPPLQHTVIQQAERGVFRRLELSAPVIIVVHKGEKQIEVDGCRWVAGPGEAIALSAPATLHVTNTPALTGAAACYRAEVFAFNPAALERAAPAVTDVGGESRHGVFTVSAPFYACLSRVVDDLVVPSSLPDSVVRHRIAEIAVWLAEAGVRLNTAPSRSIAALIRQYVSGQPARDWCVEDVLVHLGKQGKAMSGATLRRRLQGEGTSFSHLVSEARLSHALLLLQSTDMTVTQVAAEAGYDSASRFAMRFRLRFGLSPTALRGRTARV